MNRATRRFKKLGVPAAILVLTGVSGQLMRTNAGAADAATATQEAGAHDEQSLPQEPEHPEAAPADVESIDAIIEALYDVISGDKGEARDWDRFRSLFHPTLGRLVPLKHDPAKESNAARLFSPEDYARMAKNWTQSTAFYEREIRRDEESFGALAHCWSTYAGYAAIDADEPFVRGVNSIQLMNDGERWWVLSVIWDPERKGLELPAKYLPHTAKK